MAYNAGTSKARARPGLQFLRGDIDAIVAASALDESKWVMGTIPELQAVAFWPIDDDPIDQITPLLEAL